MARVNLALTFRELVLQATPAQPAHVTRLQEHDTILRWCPDCQAMVACYRNQAGVYECILGHTDNNYQTGC